MSSILVVGDSMLDRDVSGRAERLCPEQPVPVLDQAQVRSSPGGAALAAALLARDGRDVTLLTALAHDEAGTTLADLLADVRVTVVNLGYDGATREKLRLRDGPYLLCRVDRGGGTPRPAAGPTAGRVVEEASAVLVSDYGDGIAALPGVRDALRAAGRLVWDPHPRGPEPVAGATVVTPNEREARLVTGVDDVAAAADHLRRRWRAAAVCVTRGADGAVLCENDSSVVEIPVEPVGGDPCGAGDRFAATLTSLVASRVPTAEAASAACAEAGSYVAGGGWHATTPRMVATGDALTVVEAVRRRCGTVVATGGCFDLLHAGHVALLEAARRLGDCLVVCLNSDCSARRLKGADRPLVGEDDRAAVLRSLRCVDAVVLFDEDTPVDLLRRMRPDVFVKGADYDPRTLPEAAVMAELGGRVTTVPYVAGHSTSGLIEKAVLRVA